jgi:YHS domain-containing protein
MLNINIIEESTGWGDSKLKPLLEQLSKVPRDRKIIGIFDRDVKEIITFIEKDGTTYKNHSNNIYSFCIPIPPFREEYQNISIEFYYPDENLKKEYNGKRLYFTNEVAFRQFPSNKKVKVIEKLTEFRQEDEYIKKVFDEDIGECNWIHSKTKFAELVESDYDFISDFDFSNFNLIFDRIKEIIEL